MPLPKGFARALKHGLYGQRFSEPQKQGLRGMPPDAYHQEMAALRIAIDRLLERINQPGISTDELTALIQALVRAVSGITALARLQGEGTSRSTEDLLERVLRGIDPYIDDALDLQALPPGMSSSRVEVQMRLPFPDEAGEDMP
jgi:hypothetical protein